MSYPAETFDFRVPDGDARHCTRSLSPRESRLDEWKATRANIEVRPGTPTAKEAEAFAELALAAGGEIFAEVFGPNAGELLQKLYPLEGNYMSHQLALFLWVDDEIVGMFSGYSYDVKKRIAGSNMWQALKKGPLLLPRMAWKAMTLSKVLSFSEHLEEGEFCVSFVAIEPTMRGKGLSKRLLARGTEFAREQGASTLTLCVEVDNEAAVSAYRSLGMEIVSTSEPQKKPRGEGEWMMHRMSMPIAQDG